MVPDFQKIISKYDYALPDGLIAQAPASPREKAKLLVYDRKNKETAFSTFWNLPKFLAPGTVLVFNQTKVIPARLTVVKPTGGKVRLLYLSKDKNSFKFLADRKLSLGGELRIGSKKVFLVVSYNNGEYVLKPILKIDSIYNFLNKYGQTPIPPYIKKSPLREARLRQEYQSIFAKRNGSVAAPTASLHFSKKLFTKLKKAGIVFKFITLHVGLGTFAKVTEKNLKLKKLHEEEYEIDSRTAKFLNIAKDKGVSIVAVGTTSLRALESASSSSGHLKNLTGKTSLFIQEKYQFKFIDGLITNFHVPKSSLLMLVSALVGRREVLELYEQATKKKFRFFSFGDGMLIK